MKINILKLLNKLYKFSFNINNLDNQFAIISLTDPKVSKTYRTEELSSYWFGEKEKSYIIYNIDFDDALLLAKNSYSFIFKPKNGPPQYISDNIIICDKLYFSDDGSLISKTKDGDSFEYNFYDDNSLVLPFKNPPYTWDDL